jgi:aromatic ring-opening dioxygenase LigB subunit
MKKTLLTLNTLLLILGCKPSQKETIKNLKNKVKKEDVCQLLKITNEIVKTFYPDSKALLVSQTVEGIGCKMDIVKKIIKEK